MDEIRSQPTTWRRAVEHLGTVADAVAAPGERVLAIGCGTSWFVAQCFAALRERAGYGETDAACAGQLTGPDAGRRRYDRVVAFTRSGTTTEIVDALVRQPAGTHRVAVVANAATPVGAVTDT